MSSFTGTSKERISEGDCINVVVLFCRVVAVCHLNNKKVYEEPFNTRVRHSASLF